MVVLFVLPVDEMSAAALLRSCLGVARSKAHLRLLAPGQSGNPRILQGYNAISQTVFRDGSYCLHLYSRFHLSSSPAPGRRRSMEQYRSLLLLWRRRAVLKLNKSKGISHAIPNIMRGGAGISLTSKKSVAVIRIMNASASSATHSSSALVSTDVPMPAERFSTCMMSMRCVVRKRRPCRTLCEPRLRMATPMMRATLTSRP